MKLLKRALCLSFILLQSFAAMAQESPMQQWLHSFEGKKGITTVSISSAMFKLLSKISSSDPGYQEIVRFASKLQDFKIVLVEQDASKKINTNIKTEFNALVRNAPLGNFEELMSVRETNSEIIFRVWQHNNTIRELVMTVTGSDQAIIFIKGNFTLNELTQISEDMDITGMDRIKKLKK